MKEFSCEELISVASELKGFIEDNLSSFNEQKDSLATVIKNLANQRYEIAVVANMSAGKSTFLNALLGAELLPTANAATTDCATEIYHCEYDQISAEIEFSDQKEPLKLNQNELAELLEYAKKDADCVEEKYKNVQKIKLFHPLKHVEHSAQEYDIVFIDTPGPNNKALESEEKHKSQTRRVLRDSKMAIYLFNFRQTDAVLDDEHGLWSAIKERKKKDKDFEVYFVVNKIESAMDDNFKSCKIIKDQEEKRQCYLDNWYKEEGKALEKIKEAARRNCGIDEPKVYGISALYSLAFRNGSDDDFDDEFGASTEVDVNNFKKRFRAVFGADIAEEEMIKYIGVDKLEADLNEFIHSSMVQSLKRSSLNTIKSIAEEIIQSLKADICKLSEDDKEKVLKQIEQVQDYLQKETPRLAQELQEKLQTEKEDFEQIIKRKIQKDIKTAFNSQLKKMVLVAVAFLAEMVREGLSKKQALKMAYNTYDKYNITNIESFRFHPNCLRNEEELMQEALNCIREQFSEQKEAYLDKVIEIKNLFSEFSVQSFKLVNRYKKQLEDEINSTLELNTNDEVDIKVDQDITIDFTSLDFSGAMKHVQQDAVYRTESYEVSDSSWWNPFSWGRTRTVYKDIKVSDAKNEFVIDVPELYAEFSEYASEISDKLSQIECKKYLLVLDNFNCGDGAMFEQLRTMKLEQISALQNDLDKADLAIASKQQMIKQIKQIIKESK